MRNLLLKNLKFFINKFYAPKPVLKGKCKKCGHCCKNIVFLAYGEPVRTNEAFEDLKFYNKRLNWFYPSGVNDRGEMTFTCRLLSKDNKCKLYFLRSMYCRKYPLVKSLTTGEYLKPPENCGYTIEYDKNFSDYLS